MFHLCSTGCGDGVGMKRKSLDIRLNIKAFRLVGMTGFEPATTRPPDVYSNRAELHPEFNAETLIWDNPCVVARERLELSTS